MAWCECDGQLACELRAWAAKHAASATHGGLQLWCVPGTPARGRFRGCAWPCARGLPAGTGLRRGCRRCPPPTTAPLRVSKRYRRSGAAVRFQCACQGCVDAWGLLPRLSSKPRSRSWRCRGGHRFGHLRGPCGVCRGSDVGRARGRSRGPRRPCLPRPGTAASVDVTCS